MSKNKFLDAGMKIPLGNKKIDPAIIQVRLGVVKKTATVSNTSKIQRVKKNV